MPTTCGSSIRRALQGEQFFTYLKDAFHVLYAEGESAPKMMSVGLHCRLAGRPGRAAGLIRFLDYIGKHDRVWVPTRLQIAQHWHDKLAHLAADAFEIRVRSMSQISLSDLNAADEADFRCRARQRR